jgi:hypothetical protein
MIIIFDNKYENKIIEKYIFLIIKLIKKEKKEISFLIINLVAFQMLVFFFFWFKQVVDYRVVTFD